MTACKTEAGQRAWDAIHRAGGLVSVQELATQWNISRQAVDKRTRLDSFPPNVKATAVTRLFLRCEVDQWERDNLR
jgi:predicted DNA-binding transcriptional regulator AlpA